jgi:hypothetical protein
MLLLWTALISKGKSVAPMRWIMWSLVRPGPRVLAASLGLFLAALIGPVAPLGAQPIVPHEQARDIYSVPIALVDEEDRRTIEEFQRENPQYSL